SCSHSPSSTIFSNSFLSAALWPSIRFAPSSAPSTYQHSVLPYGAPSTSFAYWSSGWTCTDKSSASSNILTSNGYSSSVFLFSRSAWFSHSWLSVSPANTPSVTVDGPFGWADITHAAPVDSDGIS